MHLHLKNDATPVVQKPRKTPFHLFKQTEKKLKELENNYIIEFVPAVDLTEGFHQLVPDEESRLLLHFTHTMV